MRTGTSAMSRCPLAVVSGGLVVGVILIVGSLLVFVDVLSPQESTGCDHPDVVGAAPLATADLSTGELRNARAIVAEGLRMHIPDQGIVVALATARQESGFRNYANDGRGGDLLFLQQGIAASLRLPHEAVGSDHGSLGIFQQQWPWWGSMAELMDPRTSAAKFYRSLLQVPGWEQMPVTVAAQRVQGSAYPAAYADDEPAARALLSRLRGPAVTEPVAWAGADPACPDAATADGAVVYPLPPGARSTDLRNWGGHGSRWASVHTGTDLSAACGTPVLSATAGTVVIRRDQPWAGPWLLQVSTGPGRLTTWYAHMRDVRVYQGQRVSAGQQLGEVGALGNATGCHLHFEVHPHGGGIYQEGVDPTEWLQNNVGRDAGDDASMVVATFNTLGASHTTPGGKHAALASGVQRTPGLVALLYEHAIDVAGLQEFQRSQYRAFRRIAGDRYAVYAPPGDTENAIIWRRDRWALVRFSSFPIPYFDGHPRRMPIVILRQVATSEQVVFVNVHNPADTRRYPGQAQWRHRAVTLEVALVRHLSGGGHRVVLTGDLNDRHQAYRQIRSEAHLIGTDGSRSRRGIDWIFVSSGSLTHSAMDRSPVVAGTSDHPFLAATVSRGAD